MESPIAAGNRYIVSSDEMSVSTKDIATYLKEELLATESKNILNYQLPNVVVYLALIFDLSIRLLVPELGNV